MATINYRINEKASKDPTMIYVRFKADKDSEAPTSIVVFKRHWSKTKQSVKSHHDSDDYRDIVNKQLSDLKSLIVKKYGLDNHSGKTIDTKWLKDVILEFHNKPTSDSTDKEIFLVDFGDFYTEKSKKRTNPRTGKKLNIRTFQDYNNSVNKLKDYEKYTGSKIRLDGVSLVFHTHFLDYLRDVDKLGENTIGKVIANIKAFLKSAERYGYKVNQDYKSREFVAPSSKTVDIYFNEAEIQKIKNHEFELDGYLDNARDWLIIGLWTGLRISDFLQLRREDYNDGFIQNNNFKTGIPVVIPIHRDVQAVLDKRSGNLPREISDQNFNDYIKIVAEKVGFTEKVEGSKPVKILDGNNKKVSRKVRAKYHKYELVTSHICRRSFATNVYGTIDTLTIMKITGHKTEKQFLDYVKISPMEYAIRLKELWSKVYQKAE
ncbi:phage integrase SAM-like domain-containing protein [Flavobacterium sp. Fl-77]|uniref:Phage integrase SAM-like domain-containing protein n=1 Tax=Flavobacterium flavipigmentatum TaxID=2893884 RepID=A0AAJ2S9B2_9FLAO|nr:MULTISPECIES: phage integrase SAM-like domain-containing protein [unclassified Flavobacterium]MDX6181248.1 phage integrase SAM-like domain-containing protein [Flavobacterium sp. Fl-33]MDX6184849.1 phage integrase SAM-like domain-containing protein [Flavobacterium sp. Fl-77]UFH39941.1 site-specific integrase [Flavobacterium sp. F-70]